jgi:hypothetical protein
MAGHFRVGLQFTYFQMITDWPIPGKINLARMMTNAMNQPESLGKHGGD